MTAPARVVVVMGVAGAGKSTLGAALSASLGWVFIEGDDFHSEANRAKMRAGMPLTDEDRWGWLDALNGACAAALSDGRSIVVACSALRAAYRRRLVRGFEDCARLVHLVVGEQEAARRVAGRSHFMPASLVPSQFAALESPSADERTLIVEGTLPVREVEALVRAWPGLP